MYKFMPRTQHTAETQKCCSFSFPPGTAVTPMQSEHEGAGGASDAHKGPQRRSDWGFRLQVWQASGRTRTHLFCLVLAPPPLPHLMSRDRQTWRAAGAVATPLGFLWRVASLQTLCGANLMQLPALLELVPAADGGGSERSQKNLSLLLASRMGNTGFHTSQRPATLQPLPTMRSPRGAGIHPREVSVSQEQGPSLLECPAQSWPAAGLLSSTEACQLE